MPVTKTAKRALRGSERKRAVNTAVMSSLEIAIRLAKRLQTKDSIQNATSLADRAAKKKAIHKNKAARIKSQLSRLVKAKKNTPKKPSRSRKSK